MQVRLDIDAGADADAEETADVALRLQGLLRELDVEDVSAVRTGPAPPGSKAVDAVAVGALLVKLATSTGLASLVSTVRGWLRGTERTVKISLDGDTLEVTGVGDDEQRRLIEHFLSRHGAT